MVRRGSTVRVRQRALQKPRFSGFYFRIDLHRIQYAPVMEPFMELSDFLTARDSACFRVSGCVHADVSTGDVVPTNPVALVSATLPQGAAASFGAAIST